MSDKENLYIAGQLKKLAAILLLLLLLFNLAGYRLWFYVAQQKADAQLITSLDKETYNEQDLITIKVPLSLPYQSDSKEFERVDGEINLNGSIYKYVKRKVQDGALILVCLSDPNKARLETAKDEFFKLANSLQITGTPVKKPVSSGTVSVNDVLSEYDAQTQQWLLQVYSKTIRSTNLYKEDKYPIEPSRSPDQPPEIFIV